MSNASAWPRTCSSKALDELRICDLHCSPRASCVSGPGAFWTAASLSASSLTSFSNSHRRDFKPFTSGVLRAGDDIIGGRPSFDLTLSGTSQEGGADSHRGPGGEVIS